MSRELLFHVGMRRDEFAKDSRVWSRSRCGGPSEGATQRRLLTPAGERRILVLQTQ
jgi:hypothetical protein